MSIAEENRGVALKWIDCAVEGRSDDLMALGAPNATWWVSGQKETSYLCGTYPYAERAKHIKEFYKDAISVKFEIRGITTEGDTVVIEGAPRAETQDGRIYVNDVMIKFVVKDGKIQSVREYVDLVAVLKFMRAKTS